MNIPIDQMTVNEKLEAISLIWDSLGDTPDQIPVPDWQRSELERRSNRLDSGESTVSDWDDAEKRFDQLGK
jgi:putative addiction module component (TIGR02574 family)